MAEKLQAPDFPQGLEWLNTAEPLSLEKLRGKIVLLDFWTYCCINCMHVLPDLKKLEQKYKNELVVVGVHCAKFPNEREGQNIREAIVRDTTVSPNLDDAQFTTMRTHDAPSSRPAPSSLPRARRRRTSWCWSGGSATCRSTSGRSRTAACRSLPCRQHDHAGGGLQHAKVARDRHFSGFA